jgi:hypothetical protein
MLIKVGDIIPPCGMTYSVENSLCISTKPHFAEDFCVHKDIFQQPFVADVVKKP